jgi:hypothetical protein
LVTEVLMLSPVGLGVAGHRVVGSVLADDQLFYRVASRGGGLRAGGGRGGGRAGGGRAGHAEERAQRGHAGD